MKLVSVIASIFLVASVSASQTTKTGSLDTLIISAEKHKIALNPNLKFNNVSIDFKKSLPNNWTGYVLNVDIDISGKQTNIKDIVYTNGTELVNMLYDLKTGKDYSNSMTPELTKAYYQEKFFIAGNKNAKNKMLVFSDPLCPICIDELPGLINKVNTSDNVALYYIHFPLTMHPTARIITKASILAKKQNIKDVDYKVYNGRFADYFDAYTEKDEQVALNTFNKIIGTKFTMKELNTKELNEELEEGIKLSKDAMISGTPTIYFNGEKDPTRVEYLTHLKK